MKNMKTLCIGFIVLILMSCEQNKTEWHIHIAGTQAHPGWIDAYWSDTNGQLLLAIPADLGSFLLSTSLTQGMGSNDIGLDRAAPGELKLVHFKRIGRKLFLIQPNTRFVALSQNPSERKATEDAFVDAVLWSGNVIAEQEKKGQKKWLIDFTDYVQSDTFGISQRLDARDKGDFKIAPEYSTVLPDRIQSFAQNLELESLLTFKGVAKGHYIKDVAINNEQLSLRVHLSMQKAPDADFKARPYHPYSGGFAFSQMDFARSLSEPLIANAQVRFRLEKTTPGPQPSKVKKPILFYLDPGTPEPIRSALLEGANWWKSAFEKAGFIDAYHVEMLPEGIDPMDSRYNFIAWTHRATRGWSYGSYLADPRTGEILRGVVNLGSQRVRQDKLIAEALLAPYGKPNESELAKEAQEMALARLRQLAAHEVGHTLGFNHNFAASMQGNASVMDYPHPMITLDKTLSIKNAYREGLGAWDEYLVAHAYGEFTNESVELSQLRENARKAGMEYMSDADVRFPGAAHPGGNLWDFGQDTLATFQTIMEARKLALQNFSSRSLPKTLAQSELETRFVPLYLLHRYQVEAVVRLIGGASYGYATSDDLPQTVLAVPAQLQREALSVFWQTIDSRNLYIPPNIATMITPVPEGFHRHREYFQTKSTPLFDPLSAVEAAVYLPLDILFAPERLNRVSQQNAQDNGLSIGDLLDGLWANTWGQALPQDPQMTLTQHTVNLVALKKALISTQQPSLHEVTRAQMLSSLRNWANALNKQKPTTAAHEEASRILQGFLANPLKYEISLEVYIPPGSPI